MDYFLFISKEKYTHKVYETFLNTIRILRGFIVCLIYTQHMYPIGLELRGDLGQGWGKNCDQDLQCAQ